MALNLSGRKVVVWQGVNGLDDLIMPFFNIYDYECNFLDNIFDFIEYYNCFDVDLILNCGLTKYATEENYRIALAKLIGSVGSGVVVIVEDFDNKNIPIIFRCARTLGIDFCLDSTKVGNKILIHFKRGLRSFDVPQWAKNPSPFIEYKNKKETVDTVINAIVNQVPFSLVRIGHCEIRFLGYGQYYGDSDIKKSCYIQWGDVPPIDFIAKVKRDLEKVVSEANILGFKSRTDFKSDSLGVLDNSVFACLSNMSLLRTMQVYTSPNIHFVLGESSEFIDAIRNSSCIVIVSPRRQVYEKIKSIVAPNINVIWHSLIGEARVDGLVELNNRLIRFVEIESILRTQVRPGTLVLVGAGVAGKIYCEIARSNGGIGLDLGSTLDAWAGVDSRGSGFNIKLKNALK
jgi:hypothetical protein